MINACTIVTNYNTINLNGKATRPVHGCPTSTIGCSISVFCYACMRGY